MTSNTTDPPRLPTDVLSPGAAALYEQLLSNGGMELLGADVPQEEQVARDTAPITNGSAGTPTTGDVRSVGDSGLRLADPRVRELLARGFAARPDQAPRWLAPVAPTAALEAWLTSLETDLRRRHASVTAAFDYLNELQRLFVRGQLFVATDELVTVVTDADQLRVMSVTMRRTARENLRVFDTPNHQKTVASTRCHCPHRTNRPVVF